MNRRYLAGVAVLACFCLIISVVYACTTFRIELRDWAVEVPVSNGSETVEMRADVQEGGPAVLESWDWDWSSGLTASTPVKHADYSTIEFWSSTPGRYYVYVSAQNSSDAYDSDAGQVDVVAVDKIKIEYATYSWADVTGDTIVLLKGTKYDFKAYPNPSNASWPAGEPTWSGAASGTGEMIEVTFSSTGTQTLTAKCGSGDTGKTVTIQVVVPEPDEVSFVDYSAGEEHDIYGVVDPVWERVDDLNVNDVASYTKGSKIATGANFWASQNLTYTTPVSVDVAGSGSFTFTEHTSANFGTWPSGTTSHSSDGTLTNSIGSTDLTLTWKYKPSGTSSWITMASTSGPHEIYRVFGEPQCGSSDYTKDNISDAVSEASGATSEDDIAAEANWNVYLKCTRGAFVAHSR